ncbi:hypothetical protein [Tichowtungia aerotolerans]|nr:hypothetical protein [Tichowtungia aerotolerans]
MEICERQMEGPGIATVDDGCLLIYSKWQPELESSMGRCSV